MIVNKSKISIKYISLLIMLIVIIREIALPFVLGVFQKNQPIGLLSDLGVPGMPTRLIFKKWEDIDGLLFILGTPFYVYFLKQVSKKIAMWFVTLIIIYGLGDCLFTGIFDYSGSYFANMHSFLHAFGSIIGCMALFLANLLLIISMLYMRKNFLALIMVISQLLAVVACVTCVLIENNWPIAASILQTIGLDSLYWPILILSLQQVFFILKKLIGNYVKKQAF